MALSLYYYRAKDNQFYIFNELLTSYNKIILNFSYNSNIIINDIYVIFNGKHNRKYNNIIQNIYKIFNYKIVIVYI